MHWLFLPLAFGALILAFSTPHMSLLVLSLLAALALLLLWIRGWYLQRIGNTGGDAALTVDPAELRRLREAAAARKATGDISESTP